MRTSAETAPPTDLVTGVIRDRIAWIEFDGSRPFDGRFWTRLTTELDRVSALDVDAVALHGGAGFARGNDLAWLSAAVGRAARRGNPGTALLEAGRPMREAARTLNNSPVPTIAILRGDVIGAGAELAALTDLRTAIGPLILALPEPRLGVVPDIAPPALLETVLGTNLTRRLLIGGESVRVAPGQPCHFIDYWCDDLENVRCVLAERSVDAPRGPLLRALRRTAWRNDLLAEAAATNTELVDPAEFRAALEEYVEAK